MIYKGNVPQRGTFWGHFHGELHPAYLHARWTIIYTISMHTAISSGTPRTWLASEPEPEDASPNSLRVRDSQGLYRYGTRIQPTAPPVSPELHPEHPGREVQGNTGDNIDRICANIRHAFDTQKKWRRLARYLWTSKIPTVRARFNWYRLFARQEKVRRARRRASALLDFSQRFSGLAWGRSAKLALTTHPSEEIEAEEEDEVPTPEGRCSCCRRIKSLVRSLILVARFLQRTGHLGKIAACSYEAAKKTFGSRAFFKAVVWISPSALALWSSPEIREVVCHYSDVC